MTPDPDFDKRVLEIAEVHLDDIAIGKYQVVQMVPRKILAFAHAIRDMVMEGKVPASYVELICGPVMEAYAGTTRLADYKAMIAAAQTES